MPSRPFCPSEHIFLYITFQYLLIVLFVFLNKLMMMMMMMIRHVKNCVAGLAEEIGEGATGLSVWIKKTC